MTERENAPVVPSCEILSRSLGHVIAEITAVCGGERSLSHTLCRARARVRVSVCECVCERDRETERRSVCVRVCFFLAFKEGRERATVSCRVSVCVSLARSLVLSCSRSLSRTRACLCA